MSEGGDDRPNVIRIQTLRSPPAGKKPPPSSVSGTKSPKLETRSVIVERPRQSHMDIEGLASQSMIIQSGTGSPGASDSTEFEDEHKDEEVELKKNEKSPKRVKRTRARVSLDDESAKVLAAQLMNVMQGGQQVGKKSSLKEMVDPVLQTTLDELERCKKRRTEISYIDKDRLQRKTVVEQANFLINSGMNITKAMEVGVDEAIYIVNRAKSEQQKDTEREENILSGKARRERVSGGKKKMSLLYKATSRLPRYSLFQSKEKESAVVPVDLKRMSTSSSFNTELEKMKSLQATKTDHRRQKYAESQLSKISTKKIFSKEETENYKRLYPELWESFMRYDTDASGEIDTAELSKYLEVELGSNVSHEDIEQFFDEIDDDGNGGVSFPELAEWYHNVVGSLDLLDTKTQGATVGSIFDVARFGGFRRQLHQITKAGEVSSERLNVYEEIEHIQSRTNLIIHPHSTFHIVWDIGVSLALVITVLTLPLTMAFEELSVAMFSFNLGVDIVFLLDVVKNFWTGYVDDDGCVHMVHRRIVLKYLSTWFIPDVVSSVPIDMIISLYDDEGADPLARSAKTLKLVRLIRITKLFRLLRVGRAAKYLSFWRRYLEDKLNFRIQESTMKMLWMTATLVVLAHWVGCLQFMVCRLMDFPESSWVAIGGINHMSVGRQYMWCFFKALGQMIGLGFETPPITNLACTDLYDDWCVIEMWLTLGSMYVGSIFYAMMISNISAIIFSLNFASRQYQEKTQQVNEYMRSKHLPSGLRNKVRDYFSLRYSEGKIFNEEAIMQDLSPSLRREIRIFTSRELFLKVPLFRESGNGFISSLATSLVPMVAFQNDLIIEEGTTGDSMYFVGNGKIQIFIEELVDVQIPTDSAKRIGRSRRSSSSSNRSQVPKTVVLANIFEGCFFGEVSLLLPVRRTASARAVTVSMLYMLSRENLLLALKDFPEIYDRLKDIATARVKRVTKRLKEGEGNGGGIFGRRGGIGEKDEQDFLARSLLRVQRRESVL